MVDRRCLVIVVSFNGKPWTNLQREKEALRCGGLPELVLLFDPKPPKPVLCELLFCPKPNDIFAVGAGGEKRSMSNLESGMKGG